MAPDVVSPRPAPPPGARVPGISGTRPIAGTAAALYFGAAYYWHRRARRAERLALGALLAALAAGAGLLW